MPLTSKPGRAGLVAVVVIAALARFGVVAWARGRFPPLGDGVYYHTLALRLAEGLGYTWRWPDGAVTYAAHGPRCRRPACSRRCSGRRRRRRCIA
ncbi:MAG: hypothetical protein MUF34_37790 [Polyangiaceae bacterium]|nr:hypothetical protein [Polyangiaceae bacterium]